MSPPLLKPGMIGINLKGAIDPMGTIDTVLQGDTEAAHCWWVLPSGKIATTGARALLFYGEVEPEKYLRGKTFYLLETVDPLSAYRQDLMQAAHNQLMESGLGRLYGIWKFPILGMLAAWQGEVSKMGKEPKLTRPTCPICSQAVAWCFWKGGIPIGKMFGKQDWSAVLPETILKEAKAVSFMLANGQMDGRKTPCFMLKTVRDTPFRWE